MRSIACLIFLIVMSACGSSKLNRGKYKDWHIIYGTGGGFTGAIEQYEINSRGVLYRISIPGDTTFLKTISKGQRKELKRLIQSDTLGKLSYNTAANMSSFLYVRSKRGLLHNFQWNMTEQQLPQPLFQLDSFLNTLNQ